MSWALRAHIRNLILRASMGSSFQSTAELKKGLHARCTVDLCPYPPFAEGKAHAPPTDDTCFVGDQIDVAVSILKPQLRLSRASQQRLGELLSTQHAKDLVSDLFWFCYLKLYGRHYASKNDRRYSRESFREVMTTVFVDNDVDNSGTVDANELSELLARLDVDLPPECCSELIAVVDVDDNGELDLEEFLDMMCIQIISDVPRAAVEEDSQSLHGRCASTFLKVVSPFELSLDVRDIMHPAVCQVLGEAVLRCFKFVFGSIPNESDLQSNVNTAINMLLGGMRSMDVVKPKRPLTATSAQTYVRSTRATLKPTGVAEVDQAIDELRAELKICHRRPRPPPKQSAAGQKARQVATLTVVGKHPGQAEPLVPEMNTKGCSQAFIETYNVRTPRHMMKTLQMEHASWDFVEGQHTKDASRAATWRGGTPKSFPSVENTTGVPCKRSIAKVARRNYLAHVEKTKEKELQAQKTFHELRQLYLQATQADKENSALDKIEVCIETLGNAYARYSAFLSTDLVLKLRANSRNLLHDDAKALGRRLRVHERNVRSNELSEAQFVDL